MPVRSNEVSRSIFVPLRSMFCLIGEINVENLTGNNMEIWPLWSDK
jgi:hypothetical protein